MLLYDNSVVSFKLNICVLGKMWAILTLAGNIVGHLCREASVVYYFLKLLFYSQLSLRRTPLRPAAAVRLIGSLVTVK